MDIYERTGMRLVGYFCDKNGFYEKNTYALASGRDGSGLIVIFLASSALFSLASSASLSALALASAFLTYILGSWIFNFALGDLFKI